MHRPPHAWLMDGASLALLGAAFDRIVPAIVTLLGGAWYAAMLWEWWQERKVRRLD